MRGNFIMEGDLTASVLFLILGRRWRLEREICCDLLTGGTYNSTGSRGRLSSYFPERFFHIQHSDGF